jgi:transcriptional regulator with XRE-family HTH domain
MGKMAAGTAGSPAMSNEARGGGIKARRLALGIKSLREFAEATEIDRQALSNAEKGQGSSGTYDRAEAWLSRMEEETGLDEPTAPEPNLIRLTFHNVYGVGEIIAEGPGDKPDELVAAVAQLFATLREQGD